VAKSKNNEYWIEKGDSKKLIKKIPDKSVDLILIDPPYNLAGYSTGNIEFSWRKTINNDLAKWDTKAFIVEDWVDEFQRILSDKGNIFAFCSYNLMGDWHKTFDPLFDTFQYVVWHKTNPVPKFRRAGFLNSCELIVCMWNKGHTWNFTKQSEMHNFIETPICMGNERLKNPNHPTQKPLKVLNKIINWASDEGDTVLDCFMGVGSTGASALINKRKFIGFEVETSYFKAAEKRLKDVLKQT
jgi:DNA modification methylase